MKIESESVVDTRCGRERKKDRDLRRMKNLIQGFRDREEGLPLPIVSTRICFE